MIKYIGSKFDARQTAGGINDKTLLFCQEDLANTLLYSARIPNF